MSEETELEDGEVEVKLDEEETELETGAVDDIPNEITSDEKSDSDEPTQETDEEKSDEEKSQEEAPAEVDEAPKKWRKRVDKLTYNLREQERQKDAALDYANSVKSEIEELRQAQTLQIAQHENRSINKEADLVIQDLENANIMYADALNLGDTEKATKLNSQIADLTYQKNKLAERKQGYTNIPEQEVRPDYGKIAAHENTYRETIAQPAAAPPSDKSVSWREDNKWFGEDRIMTAGAMEIHNQLTAVENLDANSDKYYNEINKRMRDNFPHKFTADETPDVRHPTNRAPPSADLGSGRPSGAKSKTIKLTASQVTIARKLGVPLKEYAKQLKLQS